jgi:thiol-disulfide isomerase/thioredoxin
VRGLSLAKQILTGAGNKFSRVVFLIGLCAFLSVANSCVQTKDPAPRLPSETKPPSVTQIDDEKIKQLLKPSGKPLLVNFWATWCGPCREEFPDLVKIDAEYKGKIDFITITLDFEEELTTGVPKFLREMEAEMPTYLLVSADENTLIPSIAKDWSGALPFTILYNENGQIAYLRQGKVNPETLKAEIEKTLAEK